MGACCSCLPCCGKPRRVKRKLLMMGNSGIGKSCLLLSLRGLDVRPTHDITILEYVKLEIEVDDQEVDLEIWDTPGRESLDRLRTLSYPDTDLVLLCFSLDRPASLDSLLRDWYPIVHHFLPGLPLVLVGTKADLRPSSSSSSGPPGASQPAAPLVTSEDVARVVQSVGAAFYRETSAKTGENVRELFYEAVKVTLSRWYRAKKYLPRAVDSEKIPLLG